MERATRLLEESLAQHMQIRTLIERLERRDRYATVTFGVIVAAYVGYSAWTERPRHITRD